jgi:diguanylate cyclase (GGDEF)-like protein/putative nucleotidyltransferase with HDIG domain
MAGPADLLLAQVSSGADSGANDRRLRDAGRWPSSRGDVVGLAAMALVFVFGLGSALTPLVRLAGYRRRVDSARHDELRRLELAALTDSLTGLRNHRAFHEDLTREINRRNRTGTGFSLLMIDLNGLKGINDSLGHQAGDERIKAVADCLRATVRGSDAAYRIGGDEFAIILPEERGWGALNLANRLHAEVASQNGFVRVTVGVAESVGTEAKDSLIRHADLALYEAKRSHLGTVVYSPGLEPRKAPADEDANRQHQKLLASALARAVDAKDAGTRNHCETVSELCAMAARGLDLAPERVEKLRIAGLLHDVGKIGIADSILLKPEGLEAEEVRVMKTHTTIGLNIVSAAGLEDEARWVLHHHEWFDGSGYPDGLAGDEIPLESRIILVADAFEAMTGGRPYRTARPPEEALEELVAHAGTQFDPACVAALCAAFGHEPSTPLARGDELAPRRRARGGEGLEASAAAGA